MLTYVERFKFSEGSDLNVSTAFYEGWNFNSGNYLLVFTTDTK